MATLGHNARHMPQPWHLSVEMDISPSLRKGAPYGQTRRQVRHLEHLSLSITAKGTLGSGARVILTREETTALAIPSGSLS